jgi:uncharacterized protein YlxW (UPF0749 family)
MTIEERFERIEHVTAGLAEERRKDREEYRQIWRDTQRQLHELTLKIADTNDAIASMGERIEAVNQAAVERDGALGQRIESLVSAIGKFFAGGKQ